MKNMEVRCIANNCFYKDKCLMYNINSLVVYDYSCTCDKNSGFEYYIPLKNGDEDIYDESI